MATADIKPSPGVLLNIGPCGTTYVACSWSEPTVVWYHTHPLKYEAASKKSVKINFVFTEIFLRLLGECVRTHYQVKFAPNPFKISHQISPVPGSCYVGRLWPLELQAHLGWMRERMGLWLDTYLAASSCFLKEASCQGRTSSSGLINIVPLTSSECLTRCSFNEHIRQLNLFL